MTSRNRAAETPGLWVPQSSQELGSGSGPHSDLGESAQSLTSAAPLLRFCTCHAAGRSLRGTRPQPCPSSEAAVPSSQLRPAPFRLPHLHSRAKTAKLATRRDPPVQLKDATRAKEPSESDPESLTKRARRGPLAKLGTSTVGMGGTQGHREDGGAAGVPADHGKGCQCRQAGHRPEVPARDKGPGPPQ